MSCRHALIAAASVLALAACSADAFVDWPRTGISPTVNKPAMIAQDGRVTVCYGQGDPRDLPLQLAERECAPYKLRAVEIYRRRNDCTMLVPNTAVFVCFDPEKRLANGQYVNPWLEGEVRQWWEERQAIKRGEPALVPPMGDGTAFARLRGTLEQSQDGIFSASPGGAGARGGETYSPSGK